MPVQQVSFNINKVTDAEIITKIKQLASAGPYQLMKMQWHCFGEQINVPAEEIDTHSILQELVKDNSRIANTINVWFGPQVSVSIERAFSRERVWFDGVSVRCEQQQNVIPYARFISNAKKILGEAYSEATFLGAISEEMRQYVEAREQTNQQLQETTTRMITESHRLVGEMSKRFAVDLQEKHKQLEDESRKERERFQAEYDEKFNKLKEREEALGKREQELDDQEARDARRKQYEKAKEHIEKIVTVAVSKETGQKRLAVLWFTISLLVVFGGAAGYFLYLDTLSTSYVTIWRSVVFTLAFGITATFFIRWLHQWFQRLAEEELYLKRVRLDFDRANWLAELAMEWKEVEEAGIPTEILERLSRNLFMQQGGSSEADIHPLETLATALLGAAGGIKLRSPDGRLEASWDRKGVRTLEKDGEK